MDTVTQSIEELRESLTNTREAIRKLKAQRRSVIEEIRSLREKRREIINKIREERKRVRELIEEKRRAQEEYAELQKERNEVLETYKKAKELAMRLKNEYEEIISSIPISERELRRRISALERRIETGRLTVEQEREIVMRIGYFEAMLGEYARARKIKKEHLEAAAEAGRWRFFLNESSVRLREKGREIADLKKKIGEAINSLDQLSGEIEKLDEEISKKSKEADELRAQLNSLFEKLRELRENIKKIIQEREKKVEEEIIEEVAVIAKQKLKMGEKLDIGELMALVKTGEELVSGSSKEGSK